MDFYQKLRKVQKKERDNGTLAHVEETFYSDIQGYISELRQSAIDDPFSDVYNTLSNTRMIATDICERREHKITEAAVSVIQRSHKLFSSKVEFDLVDSMPLNLTPEEETFYFSLIDTLKNHRGILAGIDVKPNKVSEIPSSEDKPSVDENSEDEIINRIDEISKAKVIENEVREPVEKQIAKTSIPKPPADKKDAPKVIDDISDIMKSDDDQFVDLDSQSSVRDAEIVTMLIFDDVDAIMGIDEKVYGPFRPQDIVMMPRLNANIFAKAHKGRFVKI